ncbi:hypothetical protein NUM3379_16900 [Kineococcus sp. NUM-3379]
MADQGQLVQTFVDFAERATGTFDIENILRDLALAAGRVLPVDGAGVAYRVGERMALVHASPALVDDAERVQDGLQTGPCKDAAATGEVVVAEDLALDGHRWPGFAEHAVALGLNAVVAVPLLARGQVWGALDLYRAAPGPFEPADLAAARSLANVACSYVVMAHDRDVARNAQQEAAHAATHDALTGLPNRALLYDRLEHAVATAQRRSAPLALLFLDLDGFKDVNDTHGHLVGDQLLVEVAARLSATLRTGDTLARLGGDEFVIVCENLPPGPSGAVAGDTTTAIAHRVRATLEQPAVLDGHTITPRVSVGVVTLSEVRGDSHELLRAADHAMYEAKRRGRAATGRDRGDRRSMPRQREQPTVLDPEAREPQHRVPGEAPADPS